MNKTTAFIVIFSFFCSLSACWSADSGVVAALEIKEASVKAGDPVEIYISIVNNEKKQIQLNIDKWPRFFYTSKSILVRSDEEPIEKTYLGKVISKEEEKNADGVVINGAIDVDVVPKGTCKYKMTISGLYDLTRPGKYTITVPSITYTIGSVANTVDVKKTLEFTVY